MLDLLSDIGIVLVVMASAALFAVMIWAGTRVH